LKAFSINIHDKYTIKNSVKSYYVDSDLTNVSRYFKFELQNITAGDCLLDYLKHRHQLVHKKIKADFLIYRYNFK